MSFVIGLTLAGLTLYTSILSYTLRQYSRSRLVLRLGETQQGLWLPRLDRYGAELSVTSSFVRLFCIVASLTWGYAAYLMQRDDLQTVRPYVEAALLNLAFLIVFAIGIPNAVATYAGETVLARSLRVLWLARFAVYPVERLLMGIDFVVRRLLGQTETPSEVQSERVEQEILDAVSEGEAHGAVDEEQKEIIESVFELHETTAAEIMTPRTDIAAIPVGAALDEVRRTIVACGHSRIPVYEGSLDHIVGVLYAKDLLRLGPGDAFDIRLLMRSVPFVPESKTCDELLREFRQQRVHIAIVLDEYGGTAGLITIEDILEELVGEIDDEYDKEPPPTFQRLDEDSLEVDGRVPIHEINAELGTELPEDADYETIAGFVFSTLGRIPATGEEFTQGPLRVTITAAEPRKINRVRIQVLREVQSA